MQIFCTFCSGNLESVDNCSRVSRRRAARPRDPEILPNAQTSCILIDPTGSHFINSRLVNSPDLTGVYPLQHAKNKKQTKLVAVLLKHGAVDVEMLVEKYNLCDQSQKSFEKGLRTAAGNNKIDHLKMFISVVQNINAVDNNPKTMRTALINAACRGHLDCYNLLFEHGACLTTQDASGYTAEDYLIDSNTCTSTVPHK